MFQGRIVYKGKKDKKKNKPINIDGKMHLVMSFP